MQIECMRTENNVETRRRVEIRISEIGGPSRNPSHVSKFSNWEIASISCRFDETFFCILYFSIYYDPEVTGMGGTRF